MLETRRFAGTLSIGVLATPAVNILPLTNPPGGLWVVLLTEKGRRIVQSERIERERVERNGRTRDGAQGTLERERAEGPTKIARLGREREKERWIEREGRGRWMLVREGSSSLPTSSSSSSSSSETRMLTPCGAASRGSPDARYRLS